VRLVPLAKARTAFLAEIAPVASTGMTTAKAGGLVLAGDVLAPADVPPQPLGLERGYAIVSRATVGASSYLPSLLASMPAFVEAGEALPPGSDAILDPEDVRETSGGAEIIAAVSPGRHVRGVGGDMAAGQVIVPAGTRLRGTHIAVLRAAGITEVPVRVPGVAIIAPQGSCASAALVMDWAAQAGADVNIAYVPQARVAGALRSAVTADLVLVAGWSGAGFRSAVCALSEAGRLIARDLALSPGAAMACGFALSAGKSAPAVLLPGRPEETLPAWLMLARPALDLLAGFTGARPSAALPLARKIASAPGMGDLALVKRQGDKWKPLAAGDISWAAVAEAEAWLAVPAESEGFAAGEIVEAEYL
jgi:molybdopterin molybdotransferase